MEGGREDLVGRAFGDDFPAQHHRCAVRDAAHDAQIVGDEQIGDTKVILQTLQELQDFIGHKLIEGGCRFITNDEIGFRRKRAGDGDALLLAARKGCR